MIVPERDFAGDETKRTEPNQSIVMSIVHVGPHHQPP